MPITRTLFLDFQKVKIFTSDLKDCWRAINLRFCSISTVPRQTAVRFVSCFMGGY